MWLLALFIVIPLVEIYLFIQVGAVIGGGWTLLLILLTAIIGAYFVKQQGLSLLFNAQRKMQENKVPAEELFDGICVLVSGLMLITPGFFTDTLGFLLLWPAFRSFMRVSLLDGIIGSFTFGLADTDTVRWGHEKYKKHHTKESEGDVIEAEFTVVDETKRSSHKDK